LLESFSAGFTSTANDEVIGERAAEVEREMQKLDNSNLNHGSEAQGKITQKDSQAQRGRFVPTQLGYSTNMVIVAQQDMTLEASLEHELTPCLCPCSVAD